MLWWTDAAISMDLWSATQHLKSILTTVASLARRLSKSYKLAVYTGTHNETSAWHVRYGFLTGITDGPRRVLSIVHDDISIP